MGMNVCVYWHVYIAGLHMAASNHLGSWRNLNMTYIYRRSRENAVK
jgi:hypothetical protein